MAKRVSQKYIKNDLASWNFVIFLTLAFVLLVVVLNMVTGMSNDLRSKAGLACPAITLPRAEDCSQGWTYKRDVNGCLSFFCEAKPSPAKTSSQ